MEHKYSDDDIINLNFNCTKCKSILCKKIKHSFIGEINECLFECKECKFKLGIYFSQCHSLKYNDKLNKNYIHGYGYNLDIYTLYSNNENRVCLYFKNKNKFNHYSPWEHISFPLQSIYYDIEKLFNKSIKLIPFL